ncbi:NFYB/HAP3 family transcription factor subunit [Candidatus Woesearchaeota archaeon]|nr:NFYB/HAP3 family transcription factor subunit [Candidatus Woesearchaeota archaeon]
MGQKQTTIIPKAPCARILMHAGAKRVSADAAEAFAEILEDIAKEIAKQASVISKHAGRKTVLDTDVNIAAKKE